MVQQDNNTSARRIVTGVYTDPTERLQVDNVQDEQPS